MKPMNLLIVVFTMLFSTLVSADEVFQEDAAELCQNLKQTTYRPKCMASIKGATFNSQALAYCKTQSSWSKIRDCLSVMTNKQLEDKPVAICTSGKYFGKDMKDCIIDIAGKSYVSDIELDMCASDKNYSRRVKCLKSATSKPYEAVVEVEQPDDIDVIKVKVTEAYNLLKDEKTTAATLLLHDLVKEFEGKAL
ncbi:Uncharacterised protein [BD1-7 clade bacterium]|uniref:Uncharacterized protein n=1 Tax=BD1-7 clade bacterium TaxID=2029982 RepID=A0A5S9P4T0_9GAMM|nr:Uncharacterised protein [BD1-7 clade bacterium]CAA0098585.1 Uncharacterised protein [BD1-7 clade bacterium]